MNVFEISGPDGTVYEVEAESIEDAAAAVNSMGAPDKSWGQVLKENFLGDNDPNTQNLGEKVGSALNKAGEAMTFGLIGDEASAAVESLVPGVDYADRRQHYRQQEEVLERDNPGLALGAEIGGALAGAAIPGGAAGTLARGSGLMPRLAASTAAGAAGGATYGAMEGEGLEDRYDRAKIGGGIGAVGGVVAPILGAGVQRLADSKAMRGAIKTVTDNAPTTDELKALGRSLYQQVDDAGVRVNPGAVRDKMGEIADSLRGEGLKFDSVGKVMPASRAALGVADEVADTTANSVPFGDLDVARRAMGHAAGSNLTNAGDTRAATGALTALDDFVMKLGPEDIDAGDIQALQTALPKARDTWARMSRSQLLDDAIENAENYQSGKASGLANQFRRILNNNKLKRGFSDAEIKVMRRVVDGTMPEKILRYLGSGLGMTAQVLGGGVAGMGGGPLGGIGGALAGTATAAGTRRASEAITQRNAEIARRLVAGGGLPKLPVASDQSRRIAEELLRRTGAVVPQ